MPIYDWKANINASLASPQESTRTRKIHHGFTTGNKNKTIPVITIGGNLIKYFLSWINVIGLSICLNTWSNQEIFKLYYVASIRKSIMQNWNNLISTQKGCISVQPYYSRSMLTFEHFHLRNNGGNWLVSIDCDLSRFVW